MGEIEGLQDLEMAGCLYGHCNTAVGVWVEGPVRLNGHRASDRRMGDKAQQSCCGSVMWPEAYPPLQHSSSTNLSAAVTVLNLMHFSSYCKQNYLDYILFFYTCCFIKAAVDSRD